MKRLRDHGFLGYVQEFSYVPRVGLQPGKIYTSRLRPEVNPVLFYITDFPTFSYTLTREMYLKPEKGALCEQSFPVYAIIGRTFPGG